LALLIFVKENHTDSQTAIGMVCIRVLVSADQQTVNEHFTVQVYY